MGKSKRQQDDEEEFVEEDEAPQKGLKKVVNNCFSSTPERFDEVTSDDEGEEDEEEEKPKKPVARQPPPKPQHPQYPVGGAPYHNYANPLAGRPAPPGGYHPQPQPMAMPPYSGHPGGGGPVHYPGGHPQPAHHQQPGPHPYPVPPHHPHGGAPYSGGGGGFGRGLPAATPQEMALYGRPVPQQQQQQQVPPAEDPGMRVRHPYEAPRIMYNLNESFEVKTKVVFSVESLNNLAVQFRGDNNGVVDPPHYSSHGYLATNISRAHVEKEWKRYIYGYQLKRGTPVHSVSSEMLESSYEEIIRLGKFLLPVGLCWEKAFAYNMPLGFGIKVMDQFLDSMNHIYDPIGDHHVSMTCGYHPIFGEAIIPETDRCVNIESLLALKTLGVPARNMNDVIASMYEPLSGNGSNYGLAMEGGVSIKHPFSELGRKSRALGHITHQDGSQPTSHRVTTEQFNEALDSLTQDEHRRYFDRGDNIEFCAIPTPVYPLSGDVRIHRGRKIHHFPVHDKRQWLGTKDDHNRIIMDNPVTFGAHVTLRFAVPLRVGAPAHQHLQQQQR